jgi:hypothetical protein
MKEMSEVTDEKMLRHIPHDDWKSLREISLEIFENRNTGTLRNIRERLELMMKRGEVERIRRAQMWLYRRTEKELPPVPGNRQLSGGPVTSTDVVLRRGNMGLNTILKVYFSMDRFEGETMDTLSKTCNIPSSTCYRCTGILDEWGWVEYMGTVTGVGGRPIALWRRRYSSVTITPTGVVLKE